VKEYTYSYMEIFLILTLDRGELLASWPSALTSQLPKPCYLVKCRQFISAIVW